GRGRAASPLLVIHLGVGDRRAEQIAEPRPLVGPAADGELIELLAVLLDAEDADVADMVVAARVDAARDVDVQPAELLGEAEVAEAASDLLRDRDRARVGEAAVVE